MSNVNAGNGVSERCSDGCRNVHAGNGVSERCLENGCRTCAPATAGAGDVRSANVEHAASATVRRVRRSARGRAVSPATAEIDRRRARRRRRSPETARFHRRCLVRRHAQARATGLAQAGVRETGRTPRGHAGDRVIHPARDEAVSAGNRRRSVVTRAARITRPKNRAGRAPSAVCIARATS
jgi:hypothetical protein